jgi:CHAT domain-containing protein
MRRWIPSLLLVVAALTASGQGLAPKPGAGGRVSIPGAGLPPVPEGSVKAAIPLYESLLAGMSVFGKTPAVARGYGFLATMYASIGNHAKAEQLFDDALAILESHGATGRDLGWVHNNRGLVHLDQRRYADGVKSFRAAVAALSADRHDLRQFRVIALQNLATTHQFLGSVEPAEDGYLEALEILRKLGRENDQVSYTTRANLASLYDGINDYAAARPILEDLEKRPDLGGTLRFAVVSHLAFVLLALRDFDGAEARFRKAIALTAEGSGGRAMAEMNLAAMHVEAGDLEQARREGEKALRLAEEVYGPNDRMTAPIVGTMGMIALARGDLVKAESLLLRARRLLSNEPGDGEALAGLTQNLAIVAQRRGQRERAIEWSREALELKSRNLERILAFGSERQRLAYRDNHYPYDQLANLGEGTLLAEAVLATKGAVLESLLAERALVRASRSPEDVELLDRIQELRVELMERIGRGEENTEQLRRALKQRETELAKRLQRPVAQRQRRTGLAQVQSALGDGQVLIEVIRYQLYEGGLTRTPWYGAVVIPRRGEPAWVQLAAAKEIDELTATLVKGLNKGDRGAHIPGQGDVTPQLRSLDRILWKPLEKMLPEGTRTVLLGTDGATAFVPWAALLDDHDIFLAERCDVTQVGSGRDLLREVAASSGKTVLALADGGNDLPYSRLEVEELARAAGQHGWQTTILMNERASELELFQHPRPGILHFATHGGQLDAEAVERRLGTNPMYRGYLLLGGGKQTRQAWKEGSADVAFAEDGILTAEEIGGLDLRDTWLTVLSACRTGAGDAMTGEGVLGLRRGFMLAGTQNLLFSLWSVDDAATAQFMSAFYERLFATGDLAKAFHETQIAELRGWRESGRTISDAVHRAGAFVLTR